MSDAAVAAKPLVNLFKNRPSHWVGDGFPVRSMFSYQEDTRALSPFLLLDYAAPHRFAPAVRPRGVGEHPHRGFETVTIVWQGALAHRDNAGNTGEIGPGDVQWMTAGRGILHEEFHNDTFTQHGGMFEVAQLWVNLPARDKMTAPGYQTLVASAIPAVDLPQKAGSLRVIAGEYGGKTGPARSFSPVMLLDLHLNAGAVFDLPLPDGFTASVLVRRSETTSQGTALLINGHSVGAEEVALFDRAGTILTLEAPAHSSAKGVDVLVMAGKPLDEPVVGHGPFVMTSSQEIRQAFADFHAGRF